MNFPLASTDHKPVFGLDSTKAFHAPLGAASPLWLAFAGVAGAGVAYWWMTHWMRPLNIEALVATPMALEPPVVVDAPVEVPPVIEAVTIEPEPAAEPPPVLEAAPVEPEVLVAEAAPPPVEVKPQLPAVLEKKPKPAPKAVAVATEPASSVVKSAPGPRKTRGKASSARRK